MQEFVDLYSVDVIEKEKSFFINNDTLLDKEDRKAHTSDTNNPKRRTIQNLFKDTQKQEQGLKIALNSFYSESEKQELISWFKNNFGKLPTDKDIYLTEWSEINTAGIKITHRTEHIKSSSLKMFYDNIKSSLENSRGVVLDATLRKIKILKNLNKHL